MGVSAEHFITIDIASASLLSYTSRVYDEELPQGPIVPAEGILVEEVSEQLGGLSLQEFFEQKTPVIVDGELSHWADRHAGLDFEISAVPKNDGSNTPFISLKDGLPYSAFIVVPSSGIACNSQAQGTLDGTGNGSFRVKVTDGSLASGSVTVLPRGHQDFVPVTFSFDVEAGDF